MTIVRAIKSVAGAGRDPVASLLKDEGAFKKWLNRLADALKGLAGMAVKALSAIVGIVVGAALF